MLEFTEPTHLKRLIETLEQLVLALQHLTRAYYDDAFRPVTRVGYIDDGYVRVRDAAASIDILEMLKEFSWAFFNLLETNRLLVDLLDAMRNAPVTVLPSSTRTTGGDTRATPISTVYGSVIVFFVDVTDISGTNPVLDLYIDIQDPTSGKWVNQDKFNTITSAGTYGLALPVRSTKYSIRWELGGTNPSFTFSVGAVVIK